MFQNMNAINTFHISYQLQKSTLKYLQTSILYFVSIFQLSEWILNPLFKSMKIEQHLLSLKGQLISIRSSKIMVTKCK